MDVQYQRIAPMYGNDAILTKNFKINGLPNFLRPVRDSAGTREHSYNNWHHKNQSELDRKVKTGSPELGLDY